MPKKKSSSPKPTAGIPQRISGPRTLQNATGFKDRLGAEQKWWGYYQKIAFEVMQTYNFLLVHPASIEYTIAYTRTLGKDHPLIQDNLIYLHDPRNEHLSLRPSLDLSMMRAYYQAHKNDFETGMPIEHWYTIGSVFQEKSEPREQLQLFMAVLGNDHPVVDAECTVAAYRYLQAIGFDQVQVLVNSIGGKQSQQQYKQELTAYYKDRKKEVCDDCQSFVSKNPLKLLLCERNECKQVNADAPQSVDWLTDDDKDHFIRVLEYLDELEVPYLLSPELVPYDEYSLKTQIALQVTTESGTNYVLAKGGRFDNMAADAIDKEIPAMKMSLDLDRCLTATRTQKLEIPEERVAQIFMAQLGDDAKKRALALREELHEAGIQTIEHFGQDSLKNQLEEAVAAKVKYTCILGQKELLDGTILVRDMDGGIQEEVPLDKLVGELKKRLA